MKRFGQVIGIRPECIADYKAHHAAIWPEIAQAILDAGITNYSIYLRDNTLFSYYEYSGPENDYQQRMAAMAQAPRMREWWDLMQAMQAPRPDRAPGEWWAAMEEVFHIG